jgi:DNA-binding NarL/FixJ family response regulator
MELLQRILIVDGYAMLNAGVRALVTGEADIEILAQAKEDSEQTSAVGELAPHLLLLDRSMPGRNDVAAVAEIKQRYADARVLVIVARNTEDCVHAMLQAGANGCIRNDATHAEFRAAIRSVLQGKTYLSTKVPQKGGYADAAGSLPGAGSARGQLTPRERDVLKLVAAGKSSRCIAKLLSLSVKTVGKHRANLMAKLDVHNAAGLTAYAIARGLN